MQKKLQLANEESMTLGFVTIRLNILILPYLGMNQIPFYSRHVVPAVKANMPFAHGMSGIAMSMQLLCNRHCI